MAAKVAIFFEISKPRGIFLLEIGKLPHRFRVFLLRRWPIIPTFAAEE